MLSKFDGNKNMKNNEWKKELIRIIQAGIATANYETGEVFFLCGIDNETEVYVGTLRRKLLPFRKKWIHQRREMKKLEEQRIAQAEEKRKQLEELAGNGRSFKLNASNRNLFIENHAGLHIGEPYLVSAGFGLHNSIDSQGILESADVYVDANATRLNELTLLSGFSRRTCPTHIEIFERRIIQDNPGNDWRFPAILGFRQLSNEEFQKNYQKALDQLNIYQI